MVDYEILSGIPTFEKGDDLRYVTPAMGLFFVRNNGDIVPIAIQLGQTAGEGNPIWTPNDSEYDWLNAKLWLRAADTQYHQVRSALAHNKKSTVSESQNNDLYRSATLVGTLEVFVAAHLSLYKQLAAEASDH